MEIDTTAQVNSTQVRASTCIASRDCGNGACVEKACVCTAGFVTRDERSPCSYEQYSQLGAFLISLFVGGLGIDWFVLAKGSTGYIVAGVFKLLTGGGLGIWWLVDVIRLGANTFKDGNGVPLKSW